MASFQEDPMPTEKEKESISPRIRFPLTQEWSSTDSVPTTKNEIFSRKTTPDYFSVWEHELSGLRNGSKELSDCRKPGAEEKSQSFYAACLQRKNPLMKAKSGSRIHFAPSPLFHSFVSF